MNDSYYNQALIEWDHVHLTVAIKTIKKSSTLIKADLLLREIDILKSIDHPNIIKFYEYFEDLDNIYIVMEYCSGGELFDRILESKGLSELDASKYMKKLLAAVNHLHLSGICHRDLKPQNFLFENDLPDAELKLIDFGLSNKFSLSKQMSTFVGTPYYLAPEILNGSYDIKCDL